MRLVLVFCLLFFSLRKVQTEVNLKFIAIISLHLKKLGSKVYEVHELPISASQSTQAQTDGPLSLK